MMSRRTVNLTPRYQSYQMFPQFTFKDSEAYHAILPTLPLIRPIPFILWSAHDSTVAPFLATFGEQMWNATGDYGSSFPPYASMVVLEVCHNRKHVQ